MAAWDGEVGCSTAACLGVSGGRPCVAEQDARTVPFDLHDSDALTLRSGRAKGRVDLGERLLVDRNALGVEDEEHGPDPITSP